MIVLALDTATGGCSVALGRDGRIIAHRSERMDRGQVEALMPMIMDLLRTAGMGFADLDRIGVTVGPGAFTGVRIGLAAARGLALATGLAAFGVTTFEAVAEPLPFDHFDSGPLIVAIESKRDDVYVQRFRKPGEPAGPAAAILPGVLSEWVGSKIVSVAGDAAERAADALRKDGVRIAAVSTAGPEARAVARIAARRQAIPETPPAPLYLRAPDVTVPPSAARLL